MKRGGANDIFFESRRGNLARVKEFVEAGADVNAKNENGHTVLMFAASNDQTAIVKYLVEKGANVNAKNNYGWTALMSAVENGDIDIAKYLVEKGADVNAKDKYWENTSLMVAVEKDDINLVKYLVEKGADVNAKDKYGKTACDLAKSTKMKALVCPAPPPPPPPEPRNIPAGSETEITYEEIKNGDVLVDFNKEYVHKRYYDAETVSKLKSNPHTREPIGKKTVYTAKIVAGGKRKTRKQKRKTKKTRKHK